MKPSEDDQMTVLNRISLADAKLRVTELLRDGSRFEITPNSGELIRAPDSLASLFRIASRIKAVGGDLTLLSASLAVTSVKGRRLWKVGTGEDLEVLVDERGSVFEWDQEVLDGPVAPSLWHYVLWVSHLLHGEPLPPS